MAVQKGPEPSRIAQGRELEVQHLAETTGLTSNQARQLLEKYGNDWDRIRLEAEAIKAAN